MTLAWIAERLGMGTKAHLFHLLYWNSRKKQETETRRRKSEQVVTAEYSENAEKERSPP